MEVGWIFLPVIGAIDAGRTVGGIKPDAKRRCERPATDIDDTSGFVRKHDGAGAENIRLDMHFAPSTIEIVDETQVELIRASRVGELRRAAFLEEGDLAIYSDGGKQRRHKAGNEVLRRVSF
jgi:hypothetical protein